MCKNKWLLLINSNIYLKPFSFTGYRLIGSWVECSPMIRETGVQSQVGSYQRLLKWYLIPTCLTLSIIRSVSRVKWSNPGKGVASSPAPWCCSYWKENLPVALDNGRQIYFTETSAMAIILNTSCTKCILWTREIKSMFFFNCYYGSFQDMQHF